MTQEKVYKKLICNKSLSRISAQERSKFLRGIVKPLPPKGIARSISKKFWKNDGKNMAIPTFNVSITKAEQKLLNAYAKIFCSAVLKVGVFIINNKRCSHYLKKMGFTKEQINLITCKQTIRKDEITQLLRLDFTTDFKKVSTCYEINADQPGGIELLDHFYRTKGQVNPIYKAYLENTHTYYIKKSQREFPVGVALLSGEYHLSKVYKKAIENYYKQKVHIIEGLNKDIFLKILKCDENGNLYILKNGKYIQIDLVYRSPRFNIEELTEVLNTPLLEAWKKNKVIIVNSPIARVCGTKMFLTYLHNRQIQKNAKLTSEEIQVIKKVLPPIFLLTPANKKKVINNKDNYVLKISLPDLDRNKKTILGLGTSVIIGQGCTKKEWAQIVNKILTDKRPWLVMEYRPLAEKSIYVDGPFYNPIHTVLGVDPYVVITPKGYKIPGYLARSVITLTDNSSELLNVKINIRGTQDAYVNDKGTTDYRLTGMGLLEVS